jgi:hypothetical protein
MTKDQTISGRLTIASSARPRYWERLEPIVLRFTAEDAVAMPARQLGCYANDSDDVRQEA